LPVVFFIVQIGVYPQPYLERMEPSVKRVLQQVEVGKQEGEELWQKVVFGRGAQEEISREHRAGSQEQAKAGKGRNRVNNKLRTKRENRWR